MKEVKRMPKYNYLGKKGFPHAGNVDVYRYANDLDYNRYDYTQMSVQVCSVPWEQGEAHIGQRTLSGIGNVVHFGTKEKRNAWFDAIPEGECFKWETRFKELHSDLTIRVPLPFDIACGYNYVRVTYNLFANDSSPLAYESADGMRSWFYFIREARFIAPNTTELVLLDDAWQTWIYDLDITSMILERGHAPMFAMQADSYLANPIANCGNLLAEDVNYGDLQKVTAAGSAVINSGDMYAVVATTSLPWGDWGSSSGVDWSCPAPSYSEYAGAPNVVLFAMDAVNLNGFMVSIDSTAPQFKQSVQCVFFIAKELVEVDSSFTFGNVACYPVVSCSKVSKELMSYDKSQWQFDSRYANLAKLYTFPYSAIELADERGNIEIIHIEDTTGRIGIDVVANLVFPYLKISAMPLGIGGSLYNAVTFKNVTTHVFDMNGRWYEHLREWDVPTFTVTLSAATEYGYSSHYDRSQMESDRTVAQGIANRTAKAQNDSGNASAATNSTNSQNLAKASYRATKTQADAGYTAANVTATASRTCTKNDAQNVVDNASAQTTANSTITTNSNTTASTDASYANSLAKAIQAWDAGMTRATANNEIDAKNASAAVGAAGGVIGSAAGGAVSGILSAGPVGAAAGAIGGLVSGGISAATSLATNAIAVSATSAQAESVISNSQSKLGETQQSNIDRTDNANSGKSANTTATNKAITTSASNTSATMKENANTTYEAQKSAADTQRNATNDAAAANRDASVAAAQASETTEKANVGRSYTAATQNAADTYTNAGNRINNLVRQAGLRAPFVYGQVADAEYAATRPMGLFANIVTESDYAIKRAGDEFLRYGYYLDRQWDFSGSWLIGRHFTFWKLRDYWCSSQIPDRYADQIRFLLLGGITVWGDPKDIGKVTIYDNGI